METPVKAALIGAVSLILAASIPLLLKTCSNNEPATPKYTSEAENLNFGIATVNQVNGKLVVHNYYTEHKIHSEGKTTKDNKVTSDIVLDLGDISELQSKWTNMIQEALDDGKTYDMAPMFNGILNQMTLLDVRILHLLNFITNSGQAYAAGNWNVNEIEVDLSLYNLERLNCIKRRSEANKDNDSVELMFFESEKTEKPRNEIIKRRFSYWVDLTTLGWHLNRVSSGEKILSKDNHEIIYYEDEPPTVIQ